MECAWSVRHVPGEPLHDGLLQLWIRDHKPLRDAVGKYQTYVRRRKRLRKDFLTMQEYALTPLGERHLNNAERLALSWSALLTKYKRVDLGGVKFRVYSAQLKTTTDNSGVAVQYLDSDNQVKLSYGILMDLVQHEFLGQTKDVMRVKWLTEVGRCWGGRVPVVRDDPNHPWNVANANTCEDLQQARRYNVVFWPYRGHGGEFVVIATPRGNMFGDSY